MYKQVRERVGVNWAVAQGARCKRRHPEMIHGSTPLIKLDQKFSIYSDLEWIDSKPDGFDPTKVERDFAIYYFG